MTDIQIHSKINPSMHPSGIVGDSQGAKSARHALGTLYIAEGKIRDLHAIVKGRALLHQKQVMASMPRPADGHKKIAPALVYDSAAAAHVTDVGKPIAQKALDAADLAIAAISDQAKHLEATIDQKITAGRNTTRGPEIRAWAARQTSPFLALGPLFQKANENQTLVAEILLGENFLSGISTDNKSALRAAAANVLAPDEVQASKETSAALGQLTTAARAFTNSAAEIFNGLQSPVIDAIDSIVSTGDDQ